MTVVPTWRGTSLDSPIAKVAIPLVAVVDSEFFPSGTACIVAPWLAITARHVVDDHFEGFRRRRPNNTDEASHITLTYVAPGGGLPVIPLFVQRTWYLEPYDIAVLHLTPASEMNMEHVWDVPRLSLLPPRPGSSIFSFGYPNSKCEVLGHDQFELRMDATTTTGTVIEVHHERRDAVRLPFPCFQTNARFDGGMSGAPVFNEQGQVCGLICQTLPAATPEEDHASYVSSLWPMLAIPINAPWDRYPTGTSYPLFEYAQTKVMDTIGLDNFVLDKLPEGHRLFCRYDISAYEVSGRPSVPTETEKL
jgi:Trypsin-like peptidase domain